MTHDLSGTCEACQAIFLKYPLFAGELMIWFKSVQREIPDFHISCAGRGRASQNLFFKSGLSKAPYAQSAHNYNAAIDTFRLKDGKYELNPTWYHLVIAPCLYSGLTWYGASDAKFYELPHIELADWRDRAKNGVLTLVEL
jgi:hypothetical protein